MHTTMQVVPYSGGGGGDRDKSLLAAGSTSCLSLFALVNLTITLWFMDHLHYIKTGKGYVHVVMDCGLVLM